MACFIQLRATVPSWITDIDQLSAHIYTKRAEFAAEAENVNVLSSSLHRKRSIGSSLSSVGSQQGANPIARGLKRFLSMESSNRDDCIKKQRTMRYDESVALTWKDYTSQSSRLTLSDGRDKSPLVISYDGHTQKALEKMVRDIWTAKGIIRSSRISSSMRTIFGRRMGMQIPVKISHGKINFPEVISDTKADMQVDPDTAIATDDIDGLEDQLRLRMLMMKQRSHRNQPTCVPCQPQPQPRYRQRLLPTTHLKKSPLDFLECQLENAQNLCETAAFQFLREGNCLDELDRIKQIYELILEASTIMAEQEEEKAKAEEEQHEKDGTTNFNAPIAVDESKTPVAAGVTSTSKDIPKNDPGELNAGLLEVDDKSDTSEISIDITAFCMTRYGQRTVAPYNVYRA